MHADEIIVLEAGQVAEKGAHELQVVSHPPSDGYIKKSQID